MKIRYLYVLALLTLGVFSAVWAAEFSPMLDRELEASQSGEFVSAILILESPVDIQALDFALHARQATLAERHKEVISALKYNAEQTQPAFLKELEGEMNAGRVKGFTPYWIDNLVVVSAQKEYLESLRDRGDIKFATENFRPELIAPIPMETKPGADLRPPRRNPLDNETTTNDQNAIQTTRVNRELGITGQGVLVANCDTGVDGTHPALASRWRGNFAPVAECWRDAAGLGHTTPQDGHGHGTHVMGSITGRAISGTDTNTVGGAPNAQWIATNSINQGTGSAFDNDIIADYQWFADPDGNPGTLEDVPDAIQNSWGVNGSFSGYTTCDTRWNTAILNCEAAGPVISWSAGNEGASGLRAPAIHSFNAYQIFSVGAVDANDGAAPFPIASFSSLGPTPCTPYSPDNIKPEISAPGVSIYSSYPGGGYTTMSGTSMAGPHVAGVIALMREACPDCDHITIKEAIMQTALDQGTAGQDNTYGWGVINAYDAVLAVSTLGHLVGQVTDGSNPLSGVKVKITSGANQTLTNALGSYDLPLPDGTYNVEYSKFGYTTATVNGLVVTEGNNTTQNVVLSLAPQGIVTGSVNDCFGNPAVGATVEMLNVPVTPATTDGSGFYSMTVPQGTYDMKATGAGCGAQTVVGVIVGASATQNFTLPTDPRFECSSPDAGGYSACENNDLDGPTFSWYEIAPSAGGPGTATAIDTDDEGQSVALPFTFRLYGVNYTSAWVCGNGFVEFGGLNSTDYGNATLPTANIGPSICAFWDDLYPPDGGQIAYYYSAADNAMIVEWYNISHYPSGSNAPETFQIWLYNSATNPGPNGDSQIRVQYLNATSIASNTVGIQDGSSIASQYVYSGTLDISSQGLEANRVITYGGSTAPEFGYIAGVVTNSATSLPIAGVAVTVQGYPQNDVTDASGAYSLTLQPGAYDLDFALNGYVPASRTGIVVTNQSTTTLNVAMMALPVVTFVDEDFESGAPGWTHDAAAGWVDNWHISTERANSGTQSYKCGDTGTGTYANLCDARLTSPVFSNLPTSASLSFVMQIESELSGAYPDSAYDGGMVELSVDGGAFTLAHPTPDYTKRFRYLRGGGLPYNGPVAGAPCLAGTVTTWTTYSLDLSAYEGQSVQLRFRFGSDAGTGREGWYVDDVLGSGFGSPIPDPPTNLTIYVNKVAGTLDFDWEGTAPMYQMFSAASQDGPFDTFVGSTAATILSIPIPAGSMLFYEVVSTNGAAMSAPSTVVAPVIR